MEGVRNYLARNFMRDDMSVGDSVLFYHSNANPPGVAGVAKVSREAYPDHFAFEKRSKYHDEKSTQGTPRARKVATRALLGTSSKGRKTR